ncbi:hypothetical protein ACQKWADRAFT_303787 [Trichoderma austrokoningii]
MFTSFLYLIDTLLSNYLSSIQSHPTPLAAMSNPVCAVDAEPMLGKFHLFGALPPELRLQIWENAARSARRGVQIFGAETIRQQHAHGPVGLELVAPKIQGASEATRVWADGNPSAYNQDFGLWAANMESRAIMRRRYQRLDEAVIAEETTAQPTGWNNPVAREPSQFVWLGRERYSKVFPSQDLLLLQPASTAPPFGAASFLALPDRFQDGSENRFRNTALSYDPAWMDGLVRANTDEARALARQELWREDSLRGVFIRALFSMAQRARPIDTEFWLVDRSCQRRQRQGSAYLPFQDDNDDEEEEDAEPRVFHAMDERYAEVKDLSECKYNTLESNTAFHFLHRLQIEVGFNISWMISCRRGHSSMPVPRGLEDLVKVLGVEPK